MDKSGRAAWNSNMEYGEMRRPHGRGGGGGAQPTQQHQQQHSQSTTLSPNAKEFVPRTKNQTNAQMPQQLPHQQNHNFGSQYSGSDYNNQVSGHNRGTGVGGAVQNRLVMQQYQNDMPQQQQHQYHHQHHHHHHHHHQQQLHEYSRPNAMNSHQNQLNSVQKRLKNVNISNNQHYNQDSTKSANYESSQGSNNSTMTDEENYALNYITEAVKFLNDDPGLFDSFESHLKKAFSKFGDSEFILSNAMEIIFVQSIEEQNFRYMGAKLYRLLDTINPKPNSVFRRLLNCKLEYQKEEIQNFMNHEQHKVRATTMFLAELYMQLKSDTFRIKELAENILFTIKQLLLTSSPENIKCICLTLKLCGYELEMDCPNELHEIIESLSTKVGKVDVGTGRVLETVLLLQKNNWGRSDITDQPSPVNEAPANYSDLPVFYGPDGEIMTEEENSFLESHIPQDADVDNGDDCDLIDPDGMDPEIESAYEDFLKHKPNDNKAC